MIKPDERIRRHAEDLQELADLSDRACHVAFIFIITLVGGSTYAELRGAPAHVVIAAILGIGALLAILLLLARSVGAWADGMTIFLGSLYAKDNHCVCQTDTPESDYE